MTGGITIIDEKGYAFMRGVLSYNDLNFEAKQLRGLPAEVKDPVDD